MSSDSEDDVTSSKSTVSVKTVDKLFSKIFSLQTWTCITTVIGTALMLTIILFNFYARNLFGNLMNMFVQYIILYAYAVTMLIGFALISLSSFLVNSSYWRTGMYLLFVGFMFWIAITIISFIPEGDAFSFVCIDNRCPETHWMYNTRWRNYGIQCPFPNEEDNNAEDIQVKEDTGLQDNTIGMMAAYYAGCENYKIAPIMLSAVLCGCWCVFMLSSFCIFSQFGAEFPD